MTDSVHKDLTGADLHEPKGADTALSGQVYVSDGAGSGAWTAASSVITNTAWSTGDLKMTHKATADTGWVMWSEGSIGDSSSSATIRANADCSSLFALYWNTYSNTVCPVSGGRGASAAADFAAHKTLTIPAGPARALCVAGSGAGLTTRSVGDLPGDENRTLVTANLPPYTPSGTIVNGAITTTVDGGGPNIIGTNTGTLSSGPFTAATGAKSLTLSSTQAGSSFNGSAQGGTSTAFSIIQPSTFVQVMIKL